MKSATSLLDLSLVFSQRMLLTPTKFIDEYNRRELRSDLSLSLWDQLEALHRARALTPVYRFRKNVGPILIECRRQNIDVITALTHQLGDEASLSLFLDGHSGFGQLHDPSIERFRPWPRYVRKIEGQLLWTSAFFYSPYQLLLLPMLRHVIPKLRARRTARKHSSLDLSYSLRLSEKLREYIDQETRENGELVIVLSALETTYLPWIVGHATNHRTRELESVFNNKSTFRPIEMLEWLGWDTERIKIVAERLLGVAERLDPNNDWYELTRLCRSDRWYKLRGDALVAVD